MAAIYKKEIRSLFCGLTGWLSIALILLVFGVFTAVQRADYFPDRDTADHHARAGGRAAAAYRPAALFFDAERL
jgi:hypothetical protein